jgi:hypothetical protein
MRLTGTAGTADFMLGRSSAGDVSTVTLGTAGTSGAATLSANVLNIPQYQGAVSLTTSGTSGASTFAANTLNIPQYQGALTLTTTGTSGAATLVGNTLNIPQYSGGGGTPAGGAGEVQFNSTPAGSFAASTAFVFDTAGPYLKVGAAAPSATVGVNGAGTTSATTSLHVRNYSSVDLLKVNDNGQFLLGKNGSGTTQSTASIEVSTTDTNTGIAIVPKGSGAITAAIPDGTATGGNSRGVYAVDLQTDRNAATNVASGGRSGIIWGRRNTASGLYSFASGTESSASGTSSIAIGDQCTATGTASIALNASSISSGSYSSSFGFNSRSYLYGQSSSASGTISVTGDAQNSRLTARRSITGTAAAELTLDGAAPSLTGRLIPTLTGTTNGRLWNAIVQLSAICTTAGGTVTVGESFIGTYNLGIKRIGATSLVGTVQNMITAQADTNMSSSVVTITADNANSSLKIDFTPPTGANASTVIRVVATVYLTEVGY